MSSPSENTLARMPETGTMAVAFARAALWGRWRWGPLRSSSAMPRLGPSPPPSFAFSCRYRCWPSGPIWKRAAARPRAGIAQPCSPACSLPADLIFWHLAVVNTTMANATFLATMAPVWVLLGSGLFIGEKVTKPMVAGLGLCLLGAAALVGSSIRVEPERLTGDMFGIITSVFFGC